MGRTGEHGCALTQHGGHKQSKKHEPEPEPDLLLTQAETA
jgi:hypothetical protein